MVLCFVVIWGFVFVSVFFLFVSWCDFLSHSNTRVMVSLVVALFCTSLMTGNVEHLFMYILVIHSSSAVKYQYKDFLPIKLLFC